MQQLTLNQTQQVGGGFLQPAQITYLSTIITQGITSHWAEQALKSSGYDMESSTHKSIVGPMIHAAGAALGYMLCNMYFAA